MTDTEVREKKFQDTGRCLEQHFECRNGECVLMTARCDGQPDCSDASDERNCEAAPLRDLHWQCGNASLHVSRFCDTHGDCGDGSDEDCDGRPCPDFACDNGKCLHLDKVCDLTRHCPNGEDEVACKLSHLGRWCSV